MTAAVSKLKDLVPILLCDDVPTSVAFYTKVLGFEVVNEMPDVGRSGFASIRQGGVQLMLASPSHEPTPVKVEGRFPQAIHYFYPEDVVALRERVVAAGHEASPLRVAFYGMKEFDVVDPSGHVLWFGQETDEEPTVVE